MTKRAALVAIRFTAVLAGPVSAAGPITVTVAPESVELCPGKARQVQVVVRNEGTTPISNVRVTVFTTETAQPSLVVSSPEVIEGEATRLEPGAALLATATVSATEQSFGAAAAVHFRATCVVENRSARILSVGLGKLDVKRPALPGAEGLKAEVKPAFGALHEGDSGDLALVLSNGTGVPLVVKEIRSLGAEKTSVTAVGDLPTKIAPQEAIAIPYRITADKREIVPGMHVASFQVEAEAPAACSIRLRQFPTYNVVLGVSGESELLKLVDVPSLLFLPGFLVLATAMLLWKVPALRLRVFRTDSFPIGMGNAEFWLLGITLSFVLNATAPAFVIGTRRAYSLEQIQRLWKFSVAVGIAGYAVALAADRLGARIVNAVRACRAIRPGDDPLTVLRKLAKRKWRIDAARAVTLKGSRPPVNGYALWDGETAGTTWVAPRIFCERLDDALDDSIAEEDDPSALVRRVQAAIQAGQCVLTWMQWTDGEKPGPRQLKAGDLEATTAMRLIEVRELSYPSLEKK